jgi:uncharacterized membrane protein YdjX (TVP38/TMEM64 family)
MDRYQAPLRALALLLLVGAALAATWAAGGFEPGFRMWLAARLDVLGPAAPLAFLALKPLAVMAALPAPPFTFVAGYLFGPVWGAAIDLTGLMLGATATFHSGRAVGRSAIERRLGGRLAIVDAKLATGGFWVVFFWRLVPLLPDNALNWGAGLSAVRFRAYFLGTLLGAAPAAAVYAWLGSVARP